MNFFDNKMELVSVVTPVYNSGRFLHKLMNSVLGQTYPFIEMFVVDDGSTDNSAEIVRSYIPLFEARGYNLFLIQQSNQGQAAAINNVLPKLNGHYFVWPDSDDYYSSDTAIEKMVTALKESGDEFKIARTQRNLYDEKSGAFLGMQGANFKRYEDYSLFYDALKCKNGWFFGVGAFMIDFDAFKQITGLRMAHRRRLGQNWQLMLPMLYCYRCVSISEPLLDVIIRDDSHSHITKSTNLKKLSSYRLFIEIIISTIWKIKPMPFDEKCINSLRAIKAFGKRWLDKMMSILKYQQNTVSRSKS